MERKVLLSNRERVWGEGELSEMPHRGEAIEIVMPEETNVVGGNPVLLYRVDEIYDSDDLSDDPTILQVTRLWPSRRKFVRVTNFDTERPLERG